MQGPEIKINNNKTTGMIVADRTIVRWGAIK